MQDFDTGEFSALQEVISSEVQGLERWQGQVKMCLKP
jgi:hypothetical protein